MRTVILLIVVLLPGIVYAAEDWVELGKTSVATVMLDKASVEEFKGGARAWLKFRYNETQPAQTITNGSPFDSSRNLYYVECATQKVQALELVMLYQGKTVGTFHNPLGENTLDKVKLGSGAMLLMERVCRQ